MARKPRRSIERDKYRYLEQHEALIEKIEEGPVIKKITGNHVLVEGERLLTVSERRYVAEALRQQWFPKVELREYWQQKKLKRIEDARRLAKYGAQRDEDGEFVRDEHGELVRPTSHEYGEFVRMLTGYAGRPKALKQFVRRTRKRRP